MSEHEHKLEVFGKWYELYKRLATMNKTLPDYHELYKECEELKQQFNNMFGN